MILIAPIRGGYILPSFSKEKSPDSSFTSLKNKFILSPGPNKYLSPWIFGLTSPLFVIWDWVLHSESFSIETELLIWAKQY